MAKRKGNRNVRYTKPTKAEDEAAAAQAAQTEASTGQKSEG